MYSSFIALLAVATHHPQLAITPPLFWLLAGIVACLTELFLPKRFGSKYRLIALILGICAIIVSVILWRAAIRLGFIWQYIMYDGFDIQVMYWMGLSLVSVIWIRPMFLPRKKYIIPEATEAKTLTEILPGETGKVTYEGCFWQARCADRSMAIAPQQKVYVLRREGNTLVVAPDNLFCP